MTISNPNMATNAPFYLQTPIASVAILKPKMSIFADTAHFAELSPGILRTRKFLLTHHILLTRSTTKCVLKNSVLR